MNLEELYQKIYDEYNRLKDKHNVDDIDDPKITEQMDNIFGSSFSEIDSMLQDMLQTKELKFLKLNNEVPNPEYNYELDSGFDLYSAEEIVIEPFGRALIPTGLKFEIPEGYEIQIRPKSGLALNYGLTVLNTPGTVDNGYTGEIKVIIFNVNKESKTINKGMKIAQAVLCPVLYGKFVNLINTSEIKSSERSDNGFGSTGI